MRKISTMNLPGTEHPYVALNNKPIYLQLALDQSIILMILYLPH